MVLTVRSSAGLEQEPSKLWVGGSSPSGQANCAHGGIGRHNRLKICRPQAVPVRVRVGAPTLLYMHVTYTCSAAAHAREEGTCPRRKRYQQVLWRPWRSSWLGAVRSRRYHTVREVTTRPNPAIGGARVGARRKKSQQNKALTTSNPSAAHAVTCTCCTRSSILMCILG